MKWMTLTAALAATLAFAQTASAREHHYRHGVHREARHHAHRYTEQRHYRTQTYAYAAWSPDRRASRRQAYPAWGFDGWDHQAYVSPTWGGDLWCRQSYVSPAWTIKRWSRQQAYAAPVPSSERRSRRGYEAKTWADNRWARLPRSYASASSSYPAVGSYYGGLGGRPAAWCGWQMRQLVGSDPGPQYNLARNWVHWGHAGPAGIGAVVVWPHHVGRIVGQENGVWIIESGNDGNRLRARARSIVGAIAIRWG